MALKKIVVVSLFLMAFTATTVFADDETRKKELTDAVDYAVKVLEGKGKAGLDDLKAFRFAGGEGYIYVTDMNAVVIMHPVAPELINKDCTTIKDTKGKFFGAEMKGKAEKAGKGWTSYSWPNSKKNNTPETKCSYFRTANMGGQKVIVYAALFGISEAGCQ
ncbi:MAG TPA: cache domain-containing protein [Deltaproteobacteria bacterium]|nr:cache domain-containing protein [Deltaproteobacteria bacterium]HPJ92663.1 cache domain-containing protein [Deltaproteobacteria bacterium]HPR55201.1 cache domain-containing protein [Deltaproteobacteria bacterium]